MSMLNAEVDELADDDPVAGIVEDPARMTIFFWM
jgi:hypothetical protein